MGLFPRCLDPARDQALPEDPKRALNLLERTENLLERTERRWFSSARVARRSHYPGLINNSASAGTGRRLEGSDNGADST